MKKYSTIISYLFIAAGVLGIVFTLGYDFIRPGRPRFGSNQLMGFIVSVMILLTSTRKLETSKRAFWDSILLFIYIAGLLYLVLTPHGNAQHGHNVFLGLSVFSKLDFILNVFGFVPFGYFLLSIYSASNRRHSQIFMFWIILALGLSMSTIIELIQYFIPGRWSSLMDIVANSAGTLLGMLVFRMEKLIYKRSS